MNNEEIINEEEQDQLQCVECEAYKLTLTDVDIDEKENYILNIICQHCGLIQHILLDRKFLTINFTTKKQNIKKVIKKK